MIRLMRSFYLSKPNFIKKGVAGFSSRFSFTSSEKIKKPSECYYKVLNISVKASADEIKKEYIRLAKKFHPDNQTQPSQDHLEVT